MTILLNPKTMEYVHAMPGVSADSPLCVFVNETPEDVLAELRDIDNDYRKIMGKPYYAFLDERPTP